MLHRPVPRRPDLFRRAPACIAVLVVLALGIAAATARSRGDASAAGGFSLVSASAERIRFRFEGEPAGGRRAEDGTLLFLDRVHPTAPVGAAAQLPLATTWIALPPGAPGHVSVRLLETEPVAWPEGTTPEERAALLAVLPPQGWTSEPASWMANVWGLPVRFLPVVPDGRGGLLQVRSAEFTVEPAGAARGSSGGPGAGALRAKRAGGRDPLEATYRSLCLNYDQSLAWRKAKAPRAKAAIPDVWFTSTPNPWIKVHVPRRGLYAVRGEDLAAAGIPLAQIEPATVRLFRPPPLPLSETLDYEQSPSWMTEVPVEITGLDPTAHRATVLPNAVTVLVVGPEAMLPMREDVRVLVDLADMAAGNYQLAPQGLIIDQETGNGMQITVRPEQVSVTIESLFPTPSPSPTPTVEPPIPTLTNTATPEATLPVGRAVTPTAGSE